MQLEEVLKGIDYHIWTSEPEVGHFIAALIKMHKAKDIIEVGTFKGYTSACIINSLSKDSTFKSIDIEDHRPEIVKEYFDETNSKFILGDSLKELDNIPSRSADLIFLDSYHGYDQVKNEFKKSERIIRQGGLILIHDYYTSDGVPTWTDEIRGTPWLEIVVLNTTENRGLVVIRCLYAGN